MNNYYDQDGWLLTDEDENLIEESLVEKYEKELGYSKNIIFRIGIASVPDQRHLEGPKIRPCLLIMKTPYSYRGFQITSEAPKDSYRTKNRYFLKDWQQYGLKKESYINYDHFVDIDSFEPRSKLDRNDLIVLHQKIAEDYDKLVRLNPRQKWSYELLLEAIEKYTGIEPFDPKEQVSAYQVESLNRNNLKR